MSTSVNTNALVTIADVKTRLKIAVATFDDLLQDFVDIASDRIEEVISNPVVVRMVTNEVHDGDGSNELFPFHNPLVDLIGSDAPSKLASLQVRYSGLTWQNLSTDINRIYIPSDPAQAYRIVLLDDEFPRGKANIRLSYKAGWATIPQDIRQVCLEMCHMMWQESKFGADWLGRSSVNSGVGGQSYGDALKDMQSRWADALRHYRRIP